MRRTLYSEGRNLYRATRHFNLFLSAHSLNTADKHGFDDNTLYLQQDRDTQVSWVAGETGLSLYVATLILRSPKQAVG